MTALLATGCYPQPEITVTIKAAAGTAVEGEAAKTPAESTAAAGFGNLTGTITFEGTAPALEPLVKQGDNSAKDPTVCAAATIPNESLLVNAANKGIANVVIFLEKRPASVKPELDAPPTAAVDFDQKGCKFFPHVLTVRIGQELLVKSGDAIAHNTHTIPQRNEGFNQAINANERKGVPITYKKAEPQPFEVKCDLHNWMRAYHFPIDHPYVAITDADGKFTIPGLPAGKQTFKVWHEKAKGQLLIRKLDITIKADADNTQNLSYGGDKFELAGAPVPSSRSIAYSRLLQGGDLILTQTEVRP